MLEQVKKIWCTKCCQGNHPVFKTINGEQKSICPNCNAPLYKGCAETKEDKIRAYAKKIQYEGALEFGTASITIGVAEEMPVPETDPVTVESLTEEPRTVMSESMKRRLEAQKEETPLTPPITGFQASETSLSKDEDDTVYTDAVAEETTKITPKVKRVSKKK